MEKIIGLTGSPYTERARWALDHHRIAYAYHEHLPLLGEPFLRLKVRGLGLPKATVPILESEGKVYSGGLDIARRADEVGKGTPLFRAADTDAVLRFADLSDQLLNVGRAWVLANLAASSAAQAEALPRFVPAFARGAFAPSSGMVARFLQKKHQTPADIDAEVNRVVRPVLLEVRRARGERAYLLSNFSYADLAVCASFGLITPHKSANMRDATREIWTHHDLAREFADLLEWRDEVYAKHRGTRV